MSLAPPPATYTATNDLNILKNIFVPQYQYSNGYYHALVNTYLPGNVTVGGAPGSPQGGSTGTNFKIYVNGAPVMNLSDLQGWSFYYATSNLVMNSNSITTVSKLTFVGGNTGSSYMIDATTGTINVSQYWLKGVALTLSGGLPAWANYPASANVVMNGRSLSGAAFVSLSAGGTITNPASNVIGFSNAYGEQARITASGSLSIGTTAGFAGYSLNVSGGSMFKSPIRVVTDPVNADAKTFFVETVPALGAAYDVRMGSLGGNTDLYLCTGGTATSGTFSNTNRLKIAGGAGDVTVIGGSFTTSDPTKSCTVGGVGLQNSKVTARLTISAVSDTALTMTSGNQATTFILTNTGFNTLTLPGTSSAQGMYWTAKNATGTSVAVTTGGGTILNLTSPFTLSANMLTTIVYSGGASNYYAL